ncbi:hypothetical protein [Dyella agri]|uniref:Uncharacterized protein n=1 Tax=Dyella agri TaxID=1926869 RepID=A0ABW8KIQ1_9GAMM
MSKNSARQILYAKPLTGQAIRRIMSRLFPKRNDYGEASLDELVPELAQLGIISLGQFKRLMTRHRRALLRLDRSRLSKGELRNAIAEYGESFVTDALRRQYWFAYPALVRTAAEFQFGEVAVIYE